MFIGIKGSIKTLWHNIRRLSGDDAYEQYLKHYAEVHADDMDAPVMNKSGTNVPGINKPSPLSREAFFKEWQDKKWKGIKRCC